MKIREIKTAAEELQADGVTRLILDLRGNTGGLLDSGIEIEESPFANEDLQPFSSPGENAAGNGDWVLLLEIHVNAHDRLDAREFSTFLPLCMSLSLGSALLAGGILSEAWWFGICHIVKKRNRQ